MKIRVWRHRWFLFCKMSSCYCRVKKKYPLKQLHRTMSTCTSLSAKRTQQQKWTCHPGRRRRWQSLELPQSWWAADYWPLTFLVQWMTVGLHAQVPECWGNAENVTNCLLIFVQISISEISHCKRDSSSFALVIYIKTVFISEDLIQRNNYASPKLNETSRTFTKNLGK